ncbi:SEC-C metal-binding domain-containing protein [Nakamurella panacisegetis]|uniref:SEC-C metal-binding domain-containing protein n=1 Tax=Nakamurella panacisegetis TaxID=1090615 RepID=UPI0012FDACE3|nr:SEC-C metal-binding domain-containing protein [Nakamurella panacisegetis]
MTDKAALAIAAALQNEISLSRPELLAELRRRGITLGEEAFAQMWQDDRLRLLARVELADPELVVNLPLALTERVFTHRVSATEIAADQVITLPDLAALWPIIDTAPYNTVNNHPFAEVFDDEEADSVLQLAAGTLAEYAAGSLIAITVTDDGLTLAGAPEPEPSELARLSSVVLDDYLEVFGVDLVSTSPDPVFAEDEPEVLADLPRSRGAVPLEEFLALVLARHPQVFTTAGWPVADLLEQLDLEHQDGMIAVAGFDFEADSQARAEADEIEMLTETYDLDPTQAAAVVAFSDKIAEVHDAVHEWADDGTDEGNAPEVEALDLVPELPFLSDPMVVVAIAEENLTGDPHLGDMLSSILHTLTQVTPRRSQAGVAWLQGRCADLLGQIDQAQTLYEKALELDADHFPAMRELATIHSLRGDANKAVSLLQRAGVPADDPELAVVSKYTGEARADIGRNDDCWCGSGRKYKKCHLGRSDHDLESRREWLYDKVAHWIRNGSGRELLVELATTSADPAAGPEALFEAVQNPVLTDIAMFEGCYLADFLDLRGPALPADERALLEAWLDTRRGLYKIDAMDRFRGLTLTDVASGDTAVVPLTGLKSKVRVGDRVVLRLLPAGESVAVPGGLVVVPAGRRELVTGLLDLQGSDEVDPIRTAAVLFGRPAPLD